MAQVFFSCLAGALGLSSFDFQIALCLHSHFRGIQTIEIWYLSQKEGQMPWWIQCLLFGCVVLYGRLYHKSTDGVMHCIIVKIWWISCAISKNKSRGWVVCGRCASWTAVLQESCFRNIVSSHYVLYPNKLRSWNVWYKKKKNWSHEENLEGHFIINYNYLPAEC